MPRSRFHTNMIRTLPVADDSMPALGLGTWKSEPGAVGAAVQEALRLGYRHIDCAAIYGNEEEIGAALTSAAVPALGREELWVTSKLWNDAHAAEDVRPALLETLRALQLDALDLYLIHWPVVHRRGVRGPQSGADLLPLERVPIAETWGALETLVDEGLCRHIGVSNFSVVKLGALLSHARIRPAVLQVELHPYLQQDELLAFCRDERIAVTAYSPLGSADRPEGLKAADEPVLLEEPLLAELAARHGATPAQVALAWALARGTAAIPKSVHPGRLRENLAAAELTLAPEELRRIAGLERARRYVSGSFWVKEGGPYTLADLWDE